MTEHCCDHILCAYIRLKGDISLGQLDCQHSLIDEFLCMVTGCAWGNRCISLELTPKSPWFKVKKILRSHVMFVSTEVLCCMSGVDVKSTVLTFCKIMCGLSTGRVHGMW